MDLAPHGEMLQNSLCLSPQGSGTSIGTGSSDSKANELVSESGVEQGEKSGSDAGSGVGITPPLVWLSSESLNQNHRLVWLFINIICCVSYQSVPDGKVSNGVCVVSIKALDVRCPDAADARRDAPVKSKNEGRL